MSKFKLAKLAPAEGYASVYASKFDTLSLSYPQMHRLSKLKFENNLSKYFSFSIPFV